MVCCARSTFWRKTRQFSCIFCSVLSYGTAGTSGPPTTGWSYWIDCPLWLGILPPIAQGRTGPAESLFLSVLFAVRRSCWMVGSQNDRFYSKWIFHAFNELLKFSGKTHLISSFSLRWLTWKWSDKLSEHQSFTFAPLNRSSWSHVFSGFWVCTDPKFRSLPIFCHVQAHWLTSTP